MCIKEIACKIPYHFLYVCQIVRVFSIIITNGSNETNKGTHKNGAFIKDGCNSARHLIVLAVIKGLAPRKNATPALSPP
jgi:hypothetical protein